MAYQEAGGGRGYALVALLFTVAAAIVVGHASAARAQIWTGQSANSDAWSDAANWYFGPPASSAGTEISFASFVRLAPFQDIADPFVLGSMRFLSGAGD